MSDDIEVTARDGTGVYQLRKDESGDWWIVKDAPVWERMGTGDSGNNALCDALLDARRADDTRAVALELHKRLAALVYASEALARKEHRHDGCTFESVALAEQEDATNALLATPAVQVLGGERQCRP